MSRHYRKPSTAKVLVCNANPKHPKFSEMDAYFKDGLNGNKCPECDRECQEEYYQDGKRFSYWPGD